MLACACLTEKSVESVVATSNCLVTWHLSIRLDAVLEAEKLPASIANLDTTLAEVQSEDLTHGCKEEGKVKCKKECWQVCRVMWLT
jgi:hypothetical protein